MQPVNCYTTDHVHSKVICSAFAQGCGGKLVSVMGKPLEGDAMVYGVLRGCGDILHQCSWVGRNWYHMDNGYFRPGHYEGYYRVTRNAIQHEGVEPVSPARFEKLKIALQPWRKAGRNVVITPLSGGMATYWQVDHEKWLQLVMEDLSHHTDRPIIVKEKGQGSISEALQDAWCLVTHSSISAIDAILSGVPVIHLGQSCVAPVARDSLRDVETPVYPDREPWAWSLAHHQWTLAEIRRGEAWARLSN